MITKTAIDLELELKLLFLIQFTLKLYFFHCSDPFVLNTLSLGFILSASNSEQKL